MVPEIAGWLVRHFNIPHGAMTCAKIVELIQIPFVMRTWVGPRNHALDWGTHLRHLTNMAEPSVCADDASLCQNTLTTCFEVVQKDCQACNLKSEDAMEWKKLIKIG